MADVTLETVVELISANQRATHERIDALARALDRAVDAMDGRPCGVHSEALSKLRDEVDSLIGTRAAMKKTVLAAWGLIGTAAGTILTVLVTKFADKIL